MSMHGANHFISISNLSLTFSKASLVSLSRWHVPHPRRPFWRLYWNAEPGATLLWKGQKIFLDADALVLIAPQTEFKVMLKGKQISHFHVHFNLGPPYDRLNDRIVSCALNKASQNAFRRMIQHERRFTLNHRSKLWLMQWIGTALQAMPEDTWPEHEWDHRVEAATKVMSKNIQHKWTNAELSDHVHMATNSFIRLFTKEVGMAPMKWLTKERIAQASLMLEHSEESIEAIAENCGFGDRAHFSTRFKQVMHINAAAYRKACAGDESF